MKAHEFTLMKDYINKHGFDDVITHAGYLWLNLTVKQANTIKVMALRMGYPIDANDAVHIDQWIIK